MRRDQPVRALCFPRAGPVNFRSTTRWAAPVANGEAAVDHREPAGSDARVQHTQPGGSSANTTIKKARTTIHRNDMEMASAVNLDISQFG